MRDTLWVRGVAPSTGSNGWKAVVPDPRDHYASVRGKRLLAGMIFAEIHDGDLSDRGPTLPKMVLVASKPTLCHARTELCVNPVQHR